MCVSLRYVCHIGNPFRIVGCSTILASVRSRPPSAGVGTAPIVALEHNAQCVNTAVGRNERMRLDNCY